MTHRDKLLAWFATGRRIGPLQALTEMGIYRLGARIHDLREAGHLIHTELIEVTNAHGGIARVARYSYLGGPASVASKAA